MTRAIARDGDPDCDRKTRLQPRRRYYRHLVLAAVTNSIARNEIIPSHRCPVALHREAALKPLSWSYMGERRGNAVRRGLYEKPLRGEEKPMREPVPFNEVTRASRCARRKAAYAAGTASGPSRRASSTSASARTCTAVRAAGEHAPLSAGIQTWAYIFSTMTRFEFPPNRAAPRPVPDRSDVPHLNIQISNMQISNIQICPYPQLPFLSYKFEKL